MRHIRLFENFDQNVGSANDLIFDWLPFDAQLSNPIQSSIPETLSTEELVRFGEESSKNGKASQITESGLFIAHRKNSNEGFTRFIARGISPLVFEIEIFNSDFESVNKMENVDASKLDIGAFSKGASMLGRFGAFGKDNKGE